MKIKSNIIVLFCIHIVHTHIYILYIFVEINANANDVFTDYAIWNFRVWFCFIFIFKCLLKNKCTKKQKQN